MSRVLLQGDHPWAGNTGDVIERLLAAGEMCIKVRLDHMDQEVLAFSGQWRRVGRR